MDTYPQEDTQVANRLMKRYLTSLVTKETKQLRGSFHCSRMAATEKSGRVDKDVEGLTLTAAGSTVPKCNQGWGDASVWCACCAKMRTCVWSAREQVCRNK